MSSANDPTVFFRDMLSQWEAMANSVGGDAMKSEDFARGMHGATGAAMNAQSAFQAMTERALAAANLPTRGDIDALAEQIATVEKALARIEAKLAGTSAPPARPKPTRTRKSLKAAD